MRVAFSILIVGCFGGVSFAQQVTGSPPTLDVVEAVNSEKATIKIRRGTTFVTIKEIIVKVVIDGRELDQKKSMAFPTLFESRIELDLSKCRVISTEGKQLPIAEVFKRLKVDSAVAVSADSNAPAPGFLLALNPDLLIILPPAVNRPKDANVVPPIPVKAFPTPK